MSTIAIDYSQVDVFAERALEGNQLAIFHDATGLTKEQMQASAKKYLNPDKINILLVGDKQKILPGIKKLGYDIVELDADGNLAGKQAF